MRFLIINSNRHRSPWPVPPVGACAVASAAAAAGHEVRFLDLCFVRRPEKAVARATAEFRPDLVGVSIRNFDNCDWAASRGFLEETRDLVIRPIRATAGCPIVLGGGAASLMPAEFLDFFNADFVLRGDGEPAIVGLLAALESKSPLNAVPGIAYRDVPGKPSLADSGVPLAACPPVPSERNTGGQAARGTRAIHVGEPARAEDLDALPLPYPERWLDLARYARWGGAVGIQTKRGCALKCTYCAYNAIEGACYRLKSMDRIALEIAEAVRGGAREIEFIDSTFNLPLDHALAVCRMLAQKKFPVRFSTMGINPLGATEELFRALEAAGFAEIAITPETGSPRMLESLQKGFTLADLERTAALSRASRLPAIWNFLLGGPGETEETVRETFAFIDAHIPANHLVFLVAGIRIVAGSPLARMAVEDGSAAPGVGLLQPVFYDPPIGRARLLEMIEERLRHCPNHMTLRDAAVPRWLLRGAAALHRLVGSDKPMWRLVAPARKISLALHLPAHWLSKL
jgi:anaerobic magnesium-protoporphyrin IX monomethyl ester cyclase